MALKFNQKKILLLQDGEQGKQSPGNRQGSSGFVAVRFSFLGIAFDVVVSEES